METSTLESKYLGSVTCSVCKMHHSPLDEKGRCSFCRNMQTAKEARTDRAFSNLQVLGIVIAIAAFGWLVTELAKAVIAYLAMP